MREKLNQIRQLEIPDIQNRIETLEKELYALRHIAHTSRVEKPHRFRELKKEIAQCKTIIREKELANAGRDSDKKQ